MRNYYVYILASQRNGTLYVGFTDDLERRMFEHKNKLFPNSFTARYNVLSLVFYEEHSDIYEALAREARIKKWKREWKLALIEENNQDWNDLYEMLI